jgi:hypothetical protein
MTGAARTLALLAALAAGAPLAAAPESSLRPLAREASSGAPGLRPLARPMPDLAAPSGAQRVAMASPGRDAEARARPAPAVRAVPHPDGRPVITARGTVLGAAILAPEVPGVARSLRPLVRGPDVVERVMARRRALDRGAVCGDRDLQGEPAGRITGHISACGIRQAVRLRSVMGVGLTQPALLDCETAQALKKWVRQGLKPAIGSRGGGVDRIRVAAHYSCRTRNNQRGAPLSEHSFGRAIDISGVRLRDGRWITLLDHWGGGAEGRALRQMHASACGIFGTVLGPAADRWHRDHFHFDTARHRGGAYCR